MKRVINRALAVAGLQLRRLPSAKVYDASATIIKTDQFSFGFIETILNGATYFMPRYAQHRPAVAGMLQGKLYEPDTHLFVAYLCARHPGSIVHAGTFFGDMLPSFSKSVDGRVYAFEPVLENYVLAKMCLSKNNLENVILTNAGLGQALENMRISTEGPDGHHAGGGSQVGDKGQICVVVDIDRYGIDDAVLIQLDVEGFELNALKGALQTIERCRPVIAIEDNDMLCDGFLEELGYDKAADIPGLGIWCPTENATYRTDIAGFMADH